MQRQSLGSPVSKLHGHGGQKEESLIVEDDHKRKDLFASSSSSTASSSSAADYCYEDDCEAAKARRLSSSLSPPPLRPDRFIHLIPLLTLLCFLILFLFSHPPSQSDMAQFKGFKWPANRIHSAENEIGEIGRFSELRKSDVLAIRSLKEIHKHAPESRHHRKFADF